MNVDLETLRTIFADTRQHLTIAKVQRVEVATDLSLARCLCTAFPDQHEIVVQIAFAHCRANAGFFVLPEKDDLVLVAFTSPDDAYLIGYLSSKDDKIPLDAQQGASVLRAKEGKKVVVMTDTEGKLANFSGDAPQPMVLGAVLRTGFDNLITKLEAIMDQLIAGDIFLTTSPGNPTAPNPSKTSALNTLKSDLGTIRSTYLDDANTNILSQLWFTVRKN